MNLAYQLKLIPGPGLPKLSNFMRALMTHLSVNVQAYLLHINNRHSLMNRARKNK